MPKAGIEVGNTTVAAQVKRLADVAEKLLHETTRLRRDIARLADRIEPFHGQRSFPDPVINHRGAWRVVDALDVIETARRDIRSSEFHLNSIRGNMDAIASDAISRAEMKPWIRMPKGKGQDE